MSFVGRVVKFVSTFAIILVAATEVCALTPNDTHYAQYEWYAPKMNLPAAWDVTTGLSSIKIAVLDTGVVTSTSDLTGRVLAPLTTGYDSFIFGNPPPPPNPPLTDAFILSSGTTNLVRHGNIVASMIGMQINNNLGGAGMGNFTIQPIRITDSSGTSANAYSMAQGIRLAADQGAKVINLSFSVGDYGDVADAATYARSKGSLVFMPTGNTNGFLGTNDFSSIIFISGTNKTDDRWSANATTGSSWGAMTDLAAPSFEIIGANPTNIDPNRFELYSGTSYANALASGVAGLIWSVNPNLSPDQVEQILRNSAVDLGTPGRDQIFGYGRIDAGAAINMALATIPEPSVVLAGSVGVLFLLIRARKRVVSSKS